MDDIACRVTTWQSIKLKERNISFRISISNGFWNRGKVRDLIWCHDEIILPFTLSNDFVRLCNITISFIRGGTSLPSNGIFGEQHHVCLRIH
jgi:hypothetical protein